jgi:hypothetical protein
MYGDTGRTSPYFEALRGSGASWLRVQVEWRDIEPSDVAPVNYNWSTADATLRAANHACVNIVAVIGAAPWWASKTYQSPIYPERYGDFVEFVSALVERYDGDGVDDAPGGTEVHHWELYNEPDMGPHPDGSGWGEFGAEYAEMLKVAYPTIKTANPTAQVLFGGIFHDFFVEDRGTFIRSFLDDVLAAGGGDYFDIMNFHFYPAARGTWTDTNSTGLIEKTTYLRAKLREHGLDENMPMAITEAGWHNDAPPGYPSSDETQSRYVVQLFTQALALDLELMIWWMLYDPHGYPFANGLVTGNVPPQPKPAFDVYRAARTRLQIAEFKAALSAAETNDADLEAYRFFNPQLKKDFYVAWVNPITTQATRPLAVSGETATVYDKHSNLVAVHRDADDGVQDDKVTVQVGGSPVYIVINEG